MESRSNARRYLTTRRLRYGAAVLALVVAGLHMFHPTYGVVRLTIILTTDPALFRSHPRPLAFVLSATAIVTGVLLVLFGFPRKPVYAAGMVLVATYILGYFAWHLSGHGGFLPGRNPVFHGLQPHEAVITHLREDAWARVATIVESALLVVLAALYRAEQ